VQAASWINGQQYPDCNGSMSITNQGASCNGKPMLPIGATAAEGPCYGSKSKVHSVGGGAVDVNARVARSANISKSSSVCGSAQIGEDVQISADSSITGNLRIGKGAKIGRDVRISGSGSIGENVTIGDDVNLSGFLNIQNSSIKRGTNLSGQIVIDGVVLEGANCSGSGSIRAASCSINAEEKSSGSAL